jgi:hypothetical protein
MMLRRQREARAAAHTNTPAELVALEDMTGPQLKDALKALDLPVSGKVAELRERLGQAQTPAPVQPATDDNGDETAGKDLDEVVDDIADAEADTVENPTGNVDPEPDPDPADPDES